MDRWMILNMSRTASSEVLRSPRVAGVVQGAGLSQAWRPPPVHDLEATGRVWMTVLQSYSKLGGIYEHQLPTRMACKPLPATPVTDQLFVLLLHDRGRGLSRTPSCLFDA